MITRECNKGYNFGGDEARPEMIKPPDLADSFCLEYFRAEVFLSQIYSNLTDLCPG